jgi:Cu2+-exporting ATPase
MNALRLNLVNPRDGRHDRKEKSIPAESLGKIVSAETIKEEKTMKKTLKVEGMMCMHCEARVKKALEAVPGVESAVADHAAGTAVVTLAAPVADDVLRAAVEAQDYKVLGVE